jgi:CheY-like chemotaxis protein
MDKEAILIVEDEEIMRNSLMTWLSAEGHTVHGVGDGDQALTDFRVEDYDAMIIDLRLPGRDGLDVLSEVKRRNPKARVVIVTAYPSHETAVEAQRRGALDYLSKPFELARLRQSLGWPQELPEIIPPPVEEPLLEEENVSPCIWTQAGVSPDRLCTLGYRCNSGCRFHTAMSKKHKADPRIQPYLDKLTYLAGCQQCRYIMGGELSARSCPSLYQCEGCELSQAVQERVDQQLEIKAENRRRKRAALDRRHGREEDGDRTAKLVH